MSSHLSDLQNGVMFDDYKAMTHAMAKLRKTALLCASMISVGLAMIIMEWLR